MKSCLLHNMLHPHSVNIRGQYRRHSSVPKAAVAFSWGIPARALLGTLLRPPRGSVLSSRVASEHWNADVHIFALQHENCFSSSISYKCCFVLIFHWTSWNLLSKCQGCIFSNGNTAFLPLLHCDCHLQSTRTYNPTSKRHLTCGSCLQPLWEGWGGACLRVLMTFIKLQG